MPNPLTIPREVRDMIYDDFITQGQSAPVSPLGRGPRRAIHVKSRRSCDDFDDFSIVYLLVYFHSFIYIPYAERQVADLWLAAPRLRREIEEAVSRVVSRGNVCKLDGAIDRRRVYPTWVLITSRSTHVDRLEVNLRFIPDQHLDCEHPAEEEAADTLFASQGPLANVLLAMLQRFLLRGPNTWKYQTDDYSIGTLALNIITKNGSVDERFVQEWTDLEVPGLGTVTGEWLRQGLISEMRDRLQYHALVRGKWVSQLPQRIGTVAVSVDGKDEVDVSLSS
ncbi:MAG: hypothetical protein M1821_000091 [Bathelium mastoideum]|nr:MAG: hypothetical protein M1821_000091 [Bathelium mastoideum]